MKKLLDENFLMKDFQPLVTGRKINSRTQEKPRDSKLSLRNKFKQNMNTCNTQIEKVIQKNTSVSNDFAAKMQKKMEILTEKSCAKSQIENSKTESKRSVLKLKCLLPIFFENGVCTNIRYYITNIINKKVDSYVFNNDNQPLFASEYPSLSRAH